MGNEARNSFSIPQNEELRHGRGRTEKAVAGLRSTTASYALLSRQCLPR
jgi:hypothetical protein